MEYNTQRPQLKISDYGRNVYKLIQYAKGLEDRQMRTQVAQAIVDIMANCEDGIKPTDENKRKYWVHLMILADWDLDIDIPYEISKEDSEEFHPNKLEYNQGNVRYRHYGNVMERMIDRVSEYPEGEDRDVLVGQIAHAMMQDYLLWNHNTVEPEIIRNQLESLSGNRLSLNEDFQFLDSKEYLKDIEDDTRANGKKKRKKKKKH